MDLPARKPRLGDARLNGRAVDDERYEPVELRSIVSAGHDLQVNALIVSLALAGRARQPEVAAADRRDAVRMARTPARHV